MRDGVPRIAYILQDFSIGGIQTCIYNLARRLRREFEFDFVATHVEFIHPRFKEVGQTAYIPRPSDLIRYLRSNPFDIVQVQNEPVYADCALAAGVPTIVERIAMTRAAGNPKDGVDWVIASNRGMVPLVQATVYPNRITPIYNGVDVDLIRSARPDRLGFGPEDVIVGRVSRVGRGKNLQLLVRAMVEVNRRYPNARLVIVGGPTRREGYEDVWPELRRLAEPLGRSVVFTGEIDQPFDIMAGFDIATCVSIPENEGIPNSLIEPMALGKPVVSTDTGQVSELVDHDISGLLVPCDDQEALADALERLIQDPDLRARFGQAAQRKVASHFNIETQAREYADLYCQLLENPPGANGHRPSRLPPSVKRSASTEAVKRLSQQLNGYAIIRDLLPMALRQSPIRLGTSVVAELLRRSIRRTARAGR